MDPEILDSLAVAFFLQQLGTVVLANVTQTKVYSAFVQEYFK